MNKNMKNAPNANNAQIGGIPYIIATFNIILNIVQFPREVKSMILRWRIFHYSKSFYVLVTKIKMLSKEKYFTVTY